MLFLSMFSLGIGLLLSTIGIYFADIVEMYAIILTAWMYMTPIIYPLSLLPDGVLKWLQLNPMLHIITSSETWFFTEIFPLLKDGYYVLEFLLEHY